MGERDAGCVVRTVLVEHRALEQFGEGDLGDDARDGGGEDHAGDRAGLVDRLNDVLACLDDVVVVPVVGDVRDVKDAAGKRRNGQTRGTGLTVRS